MASLDSWKLGSGRDILHRGQNDAKAAKLLSDKFGLGQFCAAFRQGLLF
jgi:hypothetical protein